MEKTIAILIIIFSILQIILFFKLWGMTNNVKFIKEILTKSTLNKTENNSSPITTNPLDRLVGCWADRVKKEDKEAAQSLIPTLKKETDDVIIKINGELKVIPCKELPSIKEDHDLIYFFKEV